MNAERAREVLDEIRSWANDRAQDAACSSDAGWSEPWFQVADAADDLAIAIERLDARVTRYAGG